MNIKIGKISRSHYIEVINFIKRADVRVSNDDIENAAIICILYKLINKMQNRVISNTNRQLSFSLSLTEAWAVRKVYRHSPASGEVMVYIYPIIEKIEKFTNYNGL